MLKGEYKNVKRNFLLSLLVLALVLGLFTGCEQEPSLPRIAATLKGYNDEITALIVSHVSGNAPETFTEGTMDTVDVGFTCRVDYSDTDALDLEVFLHHWTAADGTKISGYLQVEIEYYATPVSISSIHTNRTTIYFDRTSASYDADVFDGDASSETFIVELDLFRCLSLIVDGKTLISSTVNLK
ncbi:hypothetical protein SAMN06298221_1022 [Sphaerochaeta associata]|nr:hypothetical protein SAMN06298221_1022 [Sphaerochaeta associata]